MSTDSDDDTEIEGWTTLRQNIIIIRQVGADEQFAVLWTSGEVSGGRLETVARWLEAFADDPAVRCIQTPDYHAGAFRACKLQTRDFTAADGTVVRGAAVVVLDSYGAPLGVVAEARWILTYVGDPMTAFTDTMQQANAWAARLALIGADA